MSNGLNHQRIVRRRGGFVKRACSFIFLTAGGLVMVAVFILLASWLDSLADNLLDVSRPAPIPAAISTGREYPIRKSVASDIIFRNLDNHPDRIFAPYLDSVLTSNRFSDHQAEMTRDFLNMLQIYEQRQGKDDNFTIRVLDTRTDTTLERYVLDDERRRYESKDGTETWEWIQTDRYRAAKTRDLIRKYRKLGIPEAYISIKWGRVNQVLEARRRDEPFIAHELGLTRHLGLSLLATEIGTVETFNQDRLVSSAGARGRYQLMPSLLRQNGLFHYTLRTQAGNNIRVYEEWHPLLIMEPAFLTLAAYVNAFGHEILGLSAYHTGPTNIFKLLDMYLVEAGDDYSSSTSVFDAYVWALTDGYKKVARTTSFRSYSRGYVPSLFGSLLATHHVPVDTSLTIRAECVRLKPGVKLYLVDLLNTLNILDSPASAGDHVSIRHSYQVFRALNPHFYLPEPADETARVTPRMNARLVSRVGRIPVRFFLPVGSTKRLEHAGMDLIDMSSVVHFNSQTYQPPSEAEVTVWDHQYADLVRDTEHFGFSTVNRVRLRYLVKRFAELAEAQPTPYRRRQLHIIQIHNQMWGSTYWDRLAWRIVSSRRSTSRQTHTR